MPERWRPSSPVAEAPGQWGSAWGALTHQWHGCCEHVAREEEVAS